MTGRTLMVQGTASSVGKSIIVAALLRIFRNRGLKVAPFKAQNMALNAFVTPDGGEISRAQAVQAEAAGVAPSVDMNPILLKPEAQARAQVVVMGKPIGRLSAKEYQAYKPALRAIVAGALERLRASYDLVVIEGAGSPVEINLKEHDIANMYLAKLVGAPVIMVGDIDRGGVFAHLVGTMALLDDAERKLVAALLINKFRGDRSLLEPGVKFIAERLNRPVLGVVPYISDLHIAEEDSVALEERSVAPRSDSNSLDIAVVKLPRLSNYDDFLPLERSPHINVRLVDSPKTIRSADLVVIPGTKSTVADLEWMNRNGIAQAIVERAYLRRPILGICGGCQILGQEIHDPLGVESHQAFAQGLGLLAVHTRFMADKRTSQVRARVSTESFLTCKVPREDILSAYEIHMGRITRAANVKAPFEILARNGRVEQDLDGAVSDNGAVVGTMLHGILHNQSVFDSLISYLVASRPLSAPMTEERAYPNKNANEDPYERLARVVRENIDLNLLERIVGL